MDKGQSAIKVNVCSGRHVLPGWINVDVVVSNHPKAKGPPQILADMRDIPLPSNSADELMCIHGIEHIEPWEAEKALAEWFRILRPGGKIVVECPDIIKCARNLLTGFTLAGKHPDQYGMWGLYGDNRPQDSHMLHRWGYHPASLRKVLERAGFVDIEEEQPEWHAAGASMRDMRMVAKKGTQSG